MQREGTAVAVKSVIVLTLFLILSTSIAFAATNSLCGRFSLLADRFPSCREPNPAPPPPTADLCPNVPGDQASRPCADEQCVEQGGTWTGGACELPPPPPPPSNEDGRRNTCDRYVSSPRGTLPQSCDICPNVPGVQLTAQCADKLCLDDGGTWNGTSCVMPPPDVCPNVPGDQAFGPCADQQCADDGGMWNGNSCVFSPPPQCSDGVDNDSDLGIDFPDDAGCTSATDDSEIGSVQVSAEQYFIGQSVDSNLWGRFSVAVLEERVLLYPTSFVITTTGMDQIAELHNVHLDIEDLTHTVTELHTVPLVDGIGTVTFNDSISLGAGKTVFRFHATIPSGQRFKVENGATITVSATPISDWTAMIEATGVQISLTSSALLNMGTVTIQSPGGGASGGGAPSPIPSGGGSGAGAGGGGGSN